MDALRAQLAAAEARAAIAEASLAERTAQLAPYAAAANSENKALDALFVAAQFDRGKYAHDLRFVGGLCRATRGEEALWSALIRVQRGPRKHTALMFAASSGDLERVRWLLARGPALYADMRDAVGATALYHACEEGHTAVVEELCDAGAGVDGATNEGFTPLMVASEAGFDDIVGILLAAEADVDATAAGQRRTALTFACFAGHGDVVDTLLAANADTALLGQNDSTALHIACWHGHAKIVRALLRAAADINVVNVIGRTPLHDAVVRDHFACTVALVGMGADMNVTDSTNHTPRQYARTREIKRLLDNAAAAPGF
jgi:ankyrin repeat protein